MNTILFASLIILFLINVLLIILGILNKNIINSNLRRNLIKIFSMGIVILFALTFFVTGEASLDFSLSNNISLENLETANEEKFEEELEKYYEEYSGETVKWEGNIINIISLDNNNYEVWVNVDGLEDNIQLPNVYLQDISSAVVQELDLNQDIEFEGKIDQIERIYTGLRVRLKDVSIDIVEQLEENKEFNPKDDVKMELDIIENVSLSDLERIKEDISKEDYEEHFKKYQDKNVQWQGNIINIISLDNNLYEVWVNVDGLEDNIQLPNVYLQGISSAVVQELDLNQDIEFEGEIERIEIIYTGVRVRIKNVIIKS